MSHTPDLGPDDIGYNTTSPSTCPSTAQITMSPSCSSKPRAFKSYSEAARAFADDDVREDVTDAFGKLGRAMAGMLDKFSTVAKQMHTLDLQRVSASAPAPLKPRWDALTKDFGDVFWHYRSNAAFISARLKLFYESVLPVAARNMNGRSRRSYQETVQILQSFMSISAEHAANTRTLVERALSLVQQMVAFHTEVAKLLTRRLTDGQKEVYTLAAQLSEMATQVRQLCVLNTEFQRPDVTHVSFAVFKIVSCTGTRPNRSKIPHQRMMMSESMTKVTQAYHGLDSKRNEVAHAQYSSQIRMQQNDCLAIAHSTLASLVADVSLSLESGLVLFLSIWSRLRMDCGEILQWISAAAPAEAPLVLVGYQECGPALYVTLSLALQSCVSSIDTNAGSKPTSN